MNAVDVVQRQVEAYNARDLERFAAAYAEDVRVYRMPATEPAISGRAQLREFYASQRFDKPGLHAEIVSRIVMGDKVIDHERVVGIGPEPLEVAAVYEVRDDLIANVWFFRP